MVIDKFIFNADSRYLRALREKCPHSEFSWFVFSRIWTECGEILFRISTEYGVSLRIQSKYGKVSLRIQFQCGENTN